MIEDLKNLVDATAVWPTLLVTILIFSLVPGVVLRLAVLLYPSDHPRRAELIAELEVVPRWQRPFWVAEAIPAPLFEGIPLRLTARAKRLDAAVGGAVERDGPLDGLQVDVATFRAILDATLTDREREIVVARVALGQTAQEVAVRLGMTAGGVRVLQHRALAKLGTEFERRRPASNEA
jgi:DNA-binding CsgD family transcriptional regulator